MRASQRKPAKRASELLTQPSMRAFAGAAEPALLEGRLTLDELAVFARWWGWRAGAGHRGVATRDEMLTWSADMRSPAPLQRVLKVLRTLDPASPDLAGLRAARLQKERDWRGLPPSASTKRLPPHRVAVREDELPPRWRATLMAMREGRRGAGGTPAPAPSIVVTISHKLCQLACSSRRAGLPLALDVPQLSRFIGDMEARGVCQRTIASTLAKIADFLLYTDVVEKQGLAVHVVA